MNEIAQSIAGILDPDDVDFGARVRFASPEQRARVAALASQFMIDVGTAQEWRRATFPEQMLTDLWDHAAVLGHGLDDLLDHAFVTFDELEKLAPANWRKDLPAALANAWAGACSAAVLTHESADRTVSLT